MNKGRGKISSNGNEKKENGSKLNDYPRKQTPPPDNYSEIDLEKIRTGMEILEILKKQEISQS